MRMEGCSDYKFHHYYESGILKGYIQYKMKTVVHRFEYEALLPEQFAW